MHTFASKQLAAIYAARHALLSLDLTTAKTATGAAWQTVTDLSGTALRAFFSPEPSGQRMSIDTVVDAVKAAKSSVLFCLFTPTDRALLQAFLDAGDAGKIMFGLVNTLPKPDDNDPNATVKIDVYNRTRRDRKTVTYNYFKPGTEPENFLPELSTIDTRAFSLNPPGGNVPAVHIHHKFVVIDGDTRAPTIYTGSANMSANSTSKNDENLLEIQGNAALGQLYLAEFMRLYKHYRARAVWEASHGPSAKHPVTAGSTHDPLVLKRSRDTWVKQAYQPDTADFAARVRMAKRAS